MEKLATKDDISACFRLILGREPNPEEIQGHFSRAGEPLKTIVASYINSAEFAARGIMKIDRPANIALVEYSDFKIFADSTDAAVGRHVVGGVYEPEVERVFREQLKPGMSVIDIGANIGYFTLLSRSLVGPSGKILAVEPNVENVRLIEASRRTNEFDNIDVLCAAASESLGVLTLHSEYSNGSVVPAARVDDIWTSQLVPAVILDDIIGSRTVDFVKIDIEGNEPTAMRGLARMIERSHPFVISEFSATGIIGGANAYLEFFLARGYDLGVISKTEGVEPCGRSKEKVMERFFASGNDHIDIVAF
jgi:FkbM family methyltransferase